ncbi:MAG: sugar ABC transporter substrate-binding protein [Oscillospiraceae bacterium]|nr:sugar ABC transporter substrate-binding protein [Oscillospiraceae bacterium]
MKKAKIIAILCAAIMILGLVAACGGSGSSGRVELVFALWGDPAELETTQEALDVFNDMQDRIRVTAIQIAQEEYSERLLTMAAGGNMPDCGMVDERTAIGWTREGLILPIDIYAGQPSKPKDGITFKDNGQTVAYSVASEVLGLWFNKDMFDAAGVPYPPATLETAWQWDEFIEVAKQLTFDANGNTPNDPDFDARNIVQYGAYVNCWAWQMEVWALSNGGRWYSQDGKSIVFDAAAIEGMQNVYDLYLVHNVAPFNAGQEDNGWWFSIGAGNVAMGTDGQWSTGFAGDSDIDYGVAVLPYMKQQANITAGGPVAVFADTDHPDEAAEFLRWYSDPENNWGPIEAGWWMPNMMNWFTDEALLKRWIDDTPNRARLPASSFRTAMADVALHPSTQPTGWYYTPNTDQVDRILIASLSEAANGSKTVAQVIEEVRPALEAALAG